MFCDTFPCAECDRGIFDHEWTHASEEHEGQPICEQCYESYEPYENNTVVTQREHVKMEWETEMRNLNYFRKMVAEKEDKLSMLMDKIGELA